jgi:7-keto-8-aminopelargonate synthetase-like enzyme
MLLPANAGANNYLGLSNHPLLVEAAVQALHTHGYGLSSVRFICGTQVCSQCMGMKATTACLHMEYR